MQNMLLQYLQGIPFEGGPRRRPIPFEGGFNNPFPWFGQPQLPMPFEGGNPMQPKAPMQPRISQPGFSPRADRPMNMMARYGRPQEY